MLLLACGCSSVDPDRHAVVPTSNRQLAHRAHAHLDEPVALADGNAIRLAARGSDQSAIRTPPELNPPTNSGSTEAPLDGFLEGDLMVGPKTIRDRSPDVRWPVAFHEAVHLAMQNNPIIRQNAQFLATTNPLLSQPAQNPSIYDLALQESEVLFGSRGIEAALAEFMPHFTTNAVYGRDLNVQNNLFLSGGLTPGSTLVEDTGQVQARLEQPLYTGGSIALVQNWNYAQSNQPGLLFPSYYNTSLGVEFRHPLLAGAGAEFTSVAGPIFGRNSLQNGVAQGYRIAQVNQQIAAADFEMAIRRLAFEVGEVYWQLFQAYGEYEANVAVRDASEEVWKQVAANQAALGVSAVAQAEQVYLETKATAQASLSTLYETEIRLRRLLGLPESDGRLIYPNALPITTEVPQEWSQLLGDAYAHRPELQRQKLAMQSIDWQLAAAGSLLQPRLDFVGGYQLNGFGNDLISDNSADGTTEQGYAGAYNSMLRAKQTSWNVGLQLSIPIGYRGERAQMRNLEFRATKARATLKTIEEEIRYELAASVQTKDRWLTLIETTADRQRVVQRQVDALVAEYQAGRGDRSTIDLLLRARTSLAQAQADYVRSLAGYNTALWNIHYRRGTILEQSSIEFDPVLTKM